MRLRDRERESPTDIFWLKKAARNNVYLFIKKKILFNSKGSLYIYIYTRAQVTVAAIVTIHNNHDESL